MGTVGPTELGRRIRALREARGMKGAQLARACHLSRGYISDIERGRLAPSLASLQAIAVALDVPPEQLVGADMPQVLETITLEVDGQLLHLRGAGISDLTQEDRASIRDFIAYVRQQRKGKGRGRGDRKEG